MIPKYSIIIPAHNAEDCLGRCLDSVVSQRVKDYELIVVCDACTDKTADVVRKYGEKPIIVDYQRDGLARNAGLDAARGEWVLFLDADDWWMHEYVLTQLDGVLNPLWDILFFSFICESANRQRGSKARGWSDTASPRSSNGALFVPRMRMVCRPASSLNPPTRSPPLQ